MGVWENPINWVGGVGGDKRGKFGSSWYDLVNKINSFFKK